MREFFQNWFSVEALPVAPQTWDVQGVLPGAVEVSDLVKAEFRQPITIIGFYPEIVVTSSDDLVVPTIADIAVEINSNEQKYWTAYRGTRATQAPGANFVSLGAISVRERLMLIELKNEAPDIAFKFRWKFWEATFTDSPRYEDVLINLSMFAYYPLDRKAACP